MPDVSANRDRAVPFRGDRHYFHRPTGVRRWRGRLTLLAGLAAVGWVAAEAITPGERYAAATHGPLVRAHAAWDARCDACHIPHGEPGSGSSNPLACRERWRAFRCDGCHPGPAGDEKNYAPHYAAGDRLKDDPQARDCSSCHRDHMGRDASLVRVADAACLRCHEDLRPLGSHMPPVSAFHKGHPEFRALATAQPPKRTLKFSHGHHLTTGLVYDRAELDRPGRPLTPKLIGERPGDPALRRQFREQYRKFTATGSDLDPVRLDCAACHELDPGRGKPNDDPPAIKGLPTAALAPARPRGAYFLPVVFEKHCQACHGLDLSALPAAHGVTQAFEVPHRYQPADLAVLVRGEIARQLIEAKPPPAGDPPNPILDPLPRPDPAPKGASLRAEVDALSRQVDELLFDQPAGAGGWAFGDGSRRGGYRCLECHEMQPDPAHPGRALVVRPNSPTIWMTAGQFDHSAHRMVQCAACHPGQAPTSAGPADVVVKEPLGLPGIDTCRRCHAPADTVHGQPVGGVRHGCVDCHRYHAADHPLQGPGSPAREPARRLAVEDFLGGARRPGGDR